MKGIRIAPSILAGDLADLRSAVKLADQGGADQIHLDVIDGHFAPNITFGPGTVKALRSTSNLPFDVHLMISEPLRYAARFIEAGCDLLSFHAETLNETSFDSLLSDVRSARKGFGIALKPATDIPAWLVERLHELDYIVIMTVNPGFSGQALDVSVLPKIEAARDLITKAGHEIDIEVDGGVEVENVQEVVRRGANVLVAGAAVYRASDPAAAIRELRFKALHPEVLG